MTDYIKKSHVMSYPIRIKNYDKVNGDIKFMLGIESVLDYEDSLPVFRLVHCEDCPHRQKTSICDVFDSIFPPDFYCKYGAIPLVEPTKKENKAFDDYFKSIGKRSDEDCFGDDKHDNG